MGDKQNNIYIASLNICRGAAKKMMETDLYDVMKQCTIIQLQEAGEYPPMRVGDLWILPTTHDRQLHLQERHCFTNRLATYIQKNSLIHDITPHDEELTITHNMTWSECPVEGGKAIKMANVYIAGAGSEEWSTIDKRLHMQEAWAAFTDETINMMKKGPVIISMDANAHTGVGDDGYHERRANKDPRMVDINGNFLLKFCNETGMVILNGRQGETGEPTFRNADSLIDYTLVSPSLMPFSTLRIIDSPGKGYIDHRMSVMRITGQCSAISTKPRNPVSTNMIMLRGLQALEQELTLNEMELKDLAKSDETPEAMYDGLAALVRSSTHKAYDFEKEFQKVKLPDFTTICHNAETKAQNKRRIQAYEMASKAEKDFPSMYPALLQEARNEKNKLRNMCDGIKKDHRKALAAMLQKLLEENDMASIRILIAAPSKKDHKLGTIAFAETDNQKEHIKEHIRNLFEAIEEDEVNDEAQPPLRLHANVALPTAQEVHSAIKQLKSNAAPGTDEITPRMWKTIWSRAPELVLRMIQKVWEDPTNIPQDWSWMKMSLLPKHADAANDPTKLRTICMAQVILKILTSIIRDRLYKEALTLGVMKHHQFGFRPKRSSGDAYFGLRSEALRMKETGQRPAAALVDILKAFDKVRRRALFRLLERKKFSHELIRIIKQIYLKPRAVVAQLKDTIVDIMNGVLQGDPLSPLLFAIYITDLPEAVILWDSNAKIILYADDLAIICSSRSALNRALQGLSQYCKEICLEVNVSKTKVIVFANETDQMRMVTPVTYEGQVLEEMSKVAYLGFKINKELTTEDIYKGADIQLLIQIGYIRRWYAMQKDVLPFELIRRTVVSMMRCSTTTWLPYVSSKEADKLRVREGQILREVMEASSIHPSLALWHDWKILPVTTQRGIQMLSVKDRMESYPESEPMTTWLEWDENRTKSASWMKSLPKVPEELSNKDHYKCHFWDNHYEGEIESAKQHAKGETRISGSTVCVHFEDFMARDEEEFYGDIDLTRTQRNALFGFRGSALGLAHNHPWLYNNDTTCPLCGKCLETEQHMLLSCSALDLERTKLILSFTWLNRKGIEEAESTWMKRIIREADIIELAKVILRLRNVRMKQLARMGYKGLPDWRQ